MKKPESGRKETPEEFLSRWSRRKQQVRDEADAPAPVAEQPAADAESAPDLPSVEDLDMDSDYRGFLHPKVDEALRRAALKKLFSDPHFSLIDGMDVYIDDYSISDPLPAAWLPEMKQAQNILKWAKEDRDAEAARERAAVNSATAPPPLLTDATPLPADPAVAAPDGDAAPVLNESPDSGPQNA